MSAKRGSVYDVFLQALDRGLIPSSRRERAFALLGSIPPEHADPQVLVEKGLLTADQLWDLVGEPATETVQLPPSAPEPPPPPAPVAGFLGAAGDERYEILGEIGRGGMGVVYKALDRTLGRTIAIKVLPEARTLDDTGCQRFRREAQAAARLAHPNIVQVYDVVLTERFPYFTMQFVEGADLGSMLKEGALALDRAVPMFIKVALAIAAGHKLGIIHRDVKPSNVIVDEDGEPHVTDFGLAKDLSEAAELTTAGMVMGTPAYMAPEQLDGHAAEVDARSDVFALGATLYHMVTGKAPFGGGLRREAATRPRELNPAIPPGLEAVVLKTLATSPDARHAAVNDLVADLEALGDPAEWIAQPPGVELVIEQGDIAAFAADVVAFEEARGFAGPAASVALKMGKTGMGLGTLIPDADSYRFVPTQGSIAAPRALFVEVGSRAGFRYAKMRDFSAQVLEILAREAPDTRHVAVTAQGASRGLDEFEALAAQIAGFAGALRTEQFPRDLERISLVDPDAQRVQRLRAALEQKLAGKDWAVRLRTGPGFILTRGAPPAAASAGEAPDAKAGSDSSWTDPDHKPAVFVAMARRKDIEDVFYYGIQAAAHASGFVCERLDDQPAAGETLTLFLKKLETAALLVADLTSAPPIVFVELGYAWARKCPTVLLLKGTQQLPFEVRDQRCIVYDTVKDVEDAVAAELRQLRGSRSA